MSNSRRLLFALVILAGAGGSVRADSGLDASVRKLLEDAVSKNHVAGGVALVSHRGKVVVEAAVGMRDREVKVPMTTDTIFRIASMTKPITSVGIMILVQDGKLAVNDPVSKYLPEFADPRVLEKREENSKVFWETRKAKSPITIHDLLTHTSGISYRFVNRPHLSDLYVKAGICDGISESADTQAENIKKLARLPLLFDPGTKFEYGLNTDVLGRVIEVVSGKTLEAFFHERIFEPLGMKDSSFIVPKEKRDRLAAVYTPSAEGIQRIGNKPVVMGPLVYTVTYPTREGNGFYSGGGGLCATAGDYHRFCRMMLNGGELDGKRILQPETVKKMTTNRLGKVPGSFGYGFGVAGASKGPGPSAGSFSWGGFFYTSFWIDPQREVIGVLMTQMHPSGKARIAQDFPGVVYKGLPKE